LNQSGSPQILTATYSGDGNFASSTSDPKGQSVFGTQIVAVNGASYTSSNLATDSWVTIYGDNLASSQIVASTSPYPTSLSGTTVSVTDSTGTQRLAPLYYVSPGQINMLMPTNTAFGLATITVTNANGGSASSITLVTRTAPGLFSANASGAGVAAALVQRVRPDGSQAIENVASFDGNTNALVPVPITIGSDSLYLQLYGTGIRYVSGLSKVTCTIGGQNATVLYAGAAPGFSGLDQVNVQIPAALAGAGSVNVVVTVDGQASNTVTLTFK
ncbi:MAG TPA: IPT/TIG domain-containing protein, partial [Candidatus Acidoferrum sp.]|nr:IPT/TIG domain-containing protein [Candidatus Acidoferrum sp.]